MFRFLIHKKSDWATSNKCSHPRLGFILKKRVRGFIPRNDMKIIGLHF